MDIQDHVPVGSKTTMRIGGEARWYAEVHTREDVVAAWAFAQEKGVPLIVLGGGSNTVFAGGLIAALVVRMRNADWRVDDDCVTADAGVPLASLIMGLAEQGRDLSALTGIPGTLGGALFGNAGEGFGGVWLDQFVRDVTLYDGAWKTMSCAECGFAYRDSAFKSWPSPLLLWSATLTVPSGEPAIIRANVERLLQRRLETQPHVKTAGSCFVSLPDGTPAWQKIAAAGLRGKQFGGVQISEKHANFLLNTGAATLEDIHAAIAAVRSAAPDVQRVEMRLYGNDGTLQS